MERYRLRERLEAGEFEERARAVRNGLDEAVRHAAASVEQPRDELERAVQAIWAEVLHRELASFGVDDRFLALGGTSLQAMEVLARLKTLHGGAIEPATLLDRPTVADLAAWLRDHRPAPASSSTRAERTDTGGADLAVIGMACRFPGAATPERFWENLTAGVDSVGEIPSERWDGAAIYDPSGSRPDGSISRWGSFLDDVAGFDAPFFKIDPEEAAATDPQARLLLELAAETLERAGYPSARRAGERIGVFAGVGEVAYQELVLRLLAAGQPLHAATVVGNLRNLIAGRIANALDLTGPVMAVDTACSSALVALHLARQSLLAGECDLALVGAVTLNLTPTPYQLLNRAKALSPTGRCRAFDDEADGIVPGEGAGMLLLTLNSRAERENDPVVALAKGSAVNNDGRAISPMAPNPFRQQEVIAEAYRAAGIDPAAVSYIEAHGTGTPIGDPIEIRSLAHVFPAPADGGRRLIGSVKTNLGHLLNAAGMPGLLKTILALQHGQIPPTLHYQRANRRFDLNAAGFAVNTELTPWTSEAPRLAGVNAFGFGGTNAHVILGEAPQRAAPRAAQDEGRPHLLLLSARSATALDQSVADLTSFLAARPELDAEPAAVCFSASTARDPLGHRLAAVVEGSPAEVLRRIAAGEAEQLAWRGHVARISRPRIAFLFSGQGAQYPGQGKTLAGADPVFRRVFTEAAELAGPIRGRPLLAWCWGEDVSRRDLARTDIAQPLLVAFEIALGQMALAWGLRPDAVAGHSVGEIAAACIAGSLTLPDAMSLAVARGRLMAELDEAGAMAAVFAPEEIVRAEIGRRAMAEKAAVAAINDPAQVVVSGGAEEIERLCLALENQGYRSVPLAVSHAFHSPLMAPMLAPLRDFLSGFTTPLAPSIPFLSTVSADWIDGAGAAVDADYWLAHASEPVRFAAVVERLAADGIDAFVEIGPGSSLTAMVRNTLRTRGDEIAVEALLQRGEDDFCAAFGAAGRLWVHGVDLDRRAMEGERPPRRVALPTYPFERRRLWLPDPPATSEHVRSGTASAPPDEIAKLFSRPVWVDAPLPSGIPSVGRWLVVDGDLAPGLVARFRAAGQVVATVAPGEVGAALGAGEPTVGIVHVAAFGQPEPVGSVDEIDRRQQFEIGRLLDVAHQIGAVRAERRPGRLLVVASDTHVTGDADRVVAPERAAVLGFAAALGDEIPGPASLAIDLAWRDGTDAAIENIAAEALAAPSSGLIAWRAGRRLRRVLRPKRAPSLRPVRLRGDGLYLIVGGAEGIGAEVARHLAAIAQLELVLAGRRSLDEAPRRLALIAELERMGARVSYEQVDVADPAQAEALIERIARRGPIAGVVHAAGVVDPGPLAAKTIDGVARVLAPKTRGVMALDRALDRFRQRPDFVVLFSSLSSVLPGFGGLLADYVAANAFLDAYAVARHASGSPFLAINWSAWAETGMGAAPALQAGLREAGIVPLPTSVATRAFERALTTGLGGQAAIIDVAPSHLGRIPGFEGADLTPLVVKAAWSAPAESEPRVNAPAAVAGTERRLQDLVAASLGVAPGEVAPERSFLALGLQSLVAVDLVKQLEQQSGVPLPTTLFFEHPTIRALAGYLDEHVPEFSAGVVPRPPASMDALAAAEPAGPFPLTPVQLAFYVTSKLYPDVPTLSLLRETVSGALDADLLIQAIKALIARHPMLRMRIAARGPDEGGPVQEFVDVGTVIAAWHAWFEERSGETDLNALETEIANTIFDLESAPLFRVVLQRERPDRSHLILLAHHLAVDAWSLAILSDDLWATYAALSAGKTPSLPALPSTFADYVAAAQSEASGPDAGQDRSWWAARTPALAEIADRPLPYDGEPWGAPTAPILAVTRRLTVEQSAALTRIAAGRGVSVFSLLLALFARSLARWAERRELVITVTDAGRHHRLPGIERLAGTFADVLPVALDIDLDEPANVLAGRAQASWLEARRRNRVTSVELARLAGRGPGAGPRSISNASFSFAQFPGEREQSESVCVEETSGRTGNASMRLVLLGWEAKGAIGLSWNYPSSLLRTEMAERLASSFEADLIDLIETGPRPPAEPSGVPGAARDEPAMLAPEMIRDACRTYAGKTAVEFAGRLMTYAELSARSDQLSAKLIAHGAKRNRPVALLTYRGFEAAIGILGAMGAGAPWLPLDAEAPPARLIQQLNLAGVELLVCETRTEAAAARLRAALGRPLTVISAADLPAVACAGFEPARVEPDDIAYVIFTSGSTGTPKGVPITHRSFGLYVGWVKDLYPITETDRASDNSAVFFDASAYQIVCPLAVGATVCMVPEDLMRDPDGLVDFIERERLTVWRGVSSVWERMLTAIERRMAKGEPAPEFALRLFTLGGEAMFAGTVRRWMDIYGDRQLIVNDYGPAEATITMTYHEVRERPPEHVTRIPIGRPIGTVTVAVLDEERRPVPHGEVGELFIGGPILSPGYLNDPELTARFFVDVNGERMYRSGDLVIQHEDGVLEFIGRGDDQVKIGGMRIELGDIEAALAGFPGVARAAAVKAGDAPGAEQLVAYLAMDGATTSASELRAWLGERLPAYMIPRRFVLVDHMPVTATGKVDRRALAERTLDGESVLVDAPVAAPESPTERIVAGIWASVLGLPAVGREDDFFALGGDSIRMLEVLVRLEGQTPHVPRAVAFYRNPTLAAFAAAIDAGPEETASPPVPTETMTRDRFAVTPIQAGFLLAEAFDPGVAQNWRALLMLNGPLDLDAFRRAIDTVIARHAMLRVVFPAGLRPPQQVELPVGLQLDLPYEDLTGLAGEAEQRAALEERLQAERATPFAVARWPLVRMRLCRLSADRHAWIIAAHHLIGDGMSARILGQDLLLAYDRLAQGEAPALPALRSTFRDYVRLTEIDAATPKTAAEAYWRDVFAEPYVAPTGWRRPQSATAERSLHFAVDLDAPLLDRLKAVAAADRLTLYPLVLAAYARQLARLTGSDDLVIGTALSGRDHPLPDITQVFGCFATGVPLRLRRVDGLSRLDPAQAAAVFVNALQHALPPSRIARVLPSGVRPVAAIGAQFFFTFVDLSIYGDLASESLTVRWDEAGSLYDPPAAGVDLVFAAQPSEGGLRLTFQAAASAFSAEMIASFAAGMTAELRGMADDEPPSTIRFHD